jgi:alpha-ribazole phosphatase/probable phosphoglycerate mutase
MITTVYLIRHGKTVGGEEKRYKGHIDVPLSEEGIGQVERLAKHIVERNEQGSRWQKMKTDVSTNRDDGNCTLNTIYSSDLIRAVKSAEIIGEPFGLEPVIIHQFRERSFGLWEGMSFSEIRRQYPGEFNAWAVDPVKFSPTGGESTEAVRDRVIPAFYEVLRKHPDGEIAIVSHGGITRIILCEVLGIPLQNIFRVEQNFGCLNIIEFYDDVPVVRVMNYMV